MRWLQRVHLVHKPVHHCPPPAGCPSLPPLSTLPRVPLTLQPRQVHVNSRSMQLENIEFMFCPKDRIVTVSVPVVLWNEEASVGVRKGAWLHKMRCGAGGS
jgi:hypothetical protein